VWLCHGFIDSAHHVRSFFCSLRTFFYCYRLFGQVHAGLTERAPSRQILSTERQMRVVCSSRILPASSDLSLNFWCWCWCWCWLVRSPAAVSPSTGWHYERVSTTSRNCYAAKPPSLPPPPSVCEVTPLLFVNMAHPPPPPPAYAYIRQKPNA
jgi:hypothetical protein